MITLSKTFDHIWNGKCQSLEVTVEYNPKEETAVVTKVFALECCTGVTDNKRWEDVPHAMIDLTQILEDFFPDTLDKMERYDWSLVYAEHEDMTLTEREAA